MRVLKKVKPQSTLYPNPSNGNVFIHSTFGEIAFKISNVLGNVVFHKNILSNDVSLSLSLSKGIYFYQGTLQNKILTGKILIP
ncbi:MAG: T9SS type A sorting domain-containing protein [Bacteroidetes bacterium]|nr:T9SS type A sorting domain-containing protein [Bacteroidota bacterium]